MPAADLPPVVATAEIAKPPEAVVLRRDTRNEVLATQDTPLPLIKGGRTEDALLRQAIFLTVSLTVMRPAAGAGDETLRWTFTPYLQRQLCFTSITGQFSCAAAESEELPEKADGEAPFTEPPDPSAPISSPAASSAQTAVAADLRARADALFGDDRRLKLDPMLKVAGVLVRRVAVAASPVRR